MNNKTPNKLDGTIDQVSGAVKQTAGTILGNDKMKNDGKIDSISGKTEVKAADLKDRAKEGVKVAGDAIERVGEKLSEKGFDKAGAAIKKVGDKIEHSLD